MFNRRNFLKAASVTAAASAASRHIQALSLPESLLSAQDKPVAANDHIQVALIGAGIQGQGDTKVALQVPGVKLLAVADCYQGRLDHAKELWGSDLQTTKHYEEILSRKDIDAVIIATPDHWHKQAAVDAMNAGKDVYLEKPMVHIHADGPEIIATAQKTNRILQVGSQRVSSIVYAKARDLLASGAIGKVNLVSARWDRNSSMGAWNYTVPADASESTYDWPRFLGTAPKIAFNPEKFFQWRKWKDYGTGVAGDLFVHLFSGTHFCTGSKGPTRAVSTAGLRFWNDGRDAPDVMLALFDYPEGFNLSLRVNFVDGGEESEGFLFSGDEGQLEIAGNSVIVTRVPHEQDPGLVIGTYTEAMQTQLREEHDKKYPRQHPTGEPQAQYQKFVAPEGYSDSYDHFHNFFSSVRSRKPVVEDAVFGFRAAGAALLANVSYEKDSVIHWDPINMKIV